VQCERGQQRRNDESSGKGDEDTLAVVRDGLLKGGEWAAGCHECVRVCERKGRAREGGDASKEGYDYEASGERDVRTEGPKGEKWIPGDELPGFEGGGVRY
jgi:hypothetical protein